MELHVKFVGAASFLKRMLLETFIIVMTHTPFFVKYGILMRDPQNQA